jgi:hypothetical protein
MKGRQLSGWSSVWLVGAITISSLPMEAQEKREKEHSQDILHKGYLTFHQKKEFEGKPEKFQAAIQYEKDSLATRMPFIRALFNKGYAQKDFQEIEGLLEGEIQKAMENPTHFKVVGRLFDDLMKSYPVQGMKSLVKLIPRLNLHTERGGAIFVRKRLAYWMRLMRRNPYFKDLKQAGEFLPQIIDTLFQEASPSYKPLAEEEKIRPVIEGTRILKRVVWYVEDETLLLSLLKRFLPLIFKNKEPLDQKTIFHLNEILQSLFSPSMGSNFKELQLFVKEFILSQNLDEPTLKALLKDDNNPPSLQICW